jgi:hypothetical protein
MAEPNMPVVCLGFDHPDQYQGSAKEQSHWGFQMGIMLGVSHSPLHVVGSYLIEFSSSASWKYLTCRQSVVQ